MQFLACFLVSITLNQEKYQELCQCAGCAGVARKRPAITHFDLRASEGSELRTGRKHFFAPLTLVRAWASNAHILLIVTPGRAEGLDAMVLKMARRGAWTERVVRSVGAIVIVRIVDVSRWRRAIPHFNFHWIIKLVMLRAKLLFPHDCLLKGLLIAASRRLYGRIYGRNRRIICMSRSAAG